MTTRREFIGNSLVVTALAAAGCQTVGSGSHRMFVDSQIHLWKAPSAEWPWVPGMTPQMPEPFTIEKLVPMMDDVGVDRVVIMPPSWVGARNDYTLEAARQMLALSAPLLSTA